MADVTVEALLRSCGFVVDKEEDEDDIRIAKVSCDVARNITGLSHEDWHQMEGVMRAGVSALVLEFARETGEPVDLADVCMSYLVMGLQIGSVAQRIKAQPMPDLEGDG